MQDFVHQQDPLKDPLRSYYFHRASEAPKAS